MKNGKRQKVRGLQNGSRGRNRLIGLLALFVCLISPSVFAGTSKTLGESALQKAFCSWALVDLARAIAHESRPYVAKALVKSHLALYGCLYGLATSPVRLEETESLRVLNLLLSALSLATHDIMQTPKTPEEFSAQLIIDEAVGLWEPIRASLLPAPCTGKA